jgi:segregation and condensation protein A
MEPNDVEDTSSVAPESDPNGRQPQAPEQPPTISPSAAADPAAEELVAEGAEAEHAATGGGTEEEIEGGEANGARPESGGANGAASPIPAAAVSSSAAPPSAMPSSAVQSTTDDGYRVKLPMFEGPLDLLLHLVKKHELDILNIPIAFITEKYVAYIRLLDELNIDVASEYLLMAATLVHIKSRMLLPNSPVDEADESMDDADVDPRAELVRRLLEYQKYKLAAEQLGSRNVLGRDVFPRGSSEEIASGQPGLEAVSMFKLLEAFQAILERSSKTQDHHIDFERFSISEKISELMDRLNVEKKLVFHEIFPPDSSRAELIITFLAILEMTKLRLTRLIQDGPLMPIYIELLVTEDEAMAEPAEDLETSLDDQEYE